ncbi:nucleotide exchange factor GrpE [Smaragdicoccus niigatensis]|uniref:nucleotide exchange factor GrpE n=1 Tax=Smaragdicoccus niigatensis TaxID=359359 RepID=UPI00037865FF|nr:nucleotide exchange factor GrpE [Smaragdicoccus niigatensis]
MTTPAGAASDTLEELVSETRQLRDLFVRRLMEDKVRAGLYSALQDEVKSSKALLEQRDHDLLFKELLLITDRISGAVEQHFSGPELVQSAADEIGELLHRRGVTRVPVDRNFDPAMHEIVGTVAARSAAEAGAIVAVHRDGYTVAGRLLRPAQITLAVAAHDASEF